MFDQHIVAYWAHLIAAPTKAGQYLRSLGFEAENTRERQRAILTDPEQGRIYWTQ